MTSAVSAAVDPERLRRLPLFAELGDEALARVAAIATELDCPAGTVLAQADDAGSGMYVVEEEPSSSRRAAASGPSSARASSSAS